MSEKKLTFVCKNCGKKSFRKLDDYKKIKCCDNPRPLIKILRNDGEKELLAMGKYFSYKNNKRIIQNEKGEEVLNIYENDDSKIQSEKKKFINIKDLQFKKEFAEIKKVLDYYMDIEEEHKNLIAVWIIGTYLHKQFSAYPYLFFNAMKGSGKTRMLNIIAELSKKGKVVGSMTEAVLFRTAEKRTFCIDEFENMNAKGNENLKLLLNSAYKRGSVVERMDTRKGHDGEVLEFKVFCPIAMANIWGMDNTLSDRCISAILEKSANKQIINLVEDFENNEDMQKIKEMLNTKTEGINDDLSYFGALFKEWNKYAKSGVSGVSGVSGMFGGLFSKIAKAEIRGRELELFLPLFIVGDMCGKGVLDDLLKLAKMVIKQKHSTDREENKDVQLYEFVAGLSSIDEFDFISPTILIQRFREHLEIKENQELWLNSRYLGKALRRLKLVIAERKTSKRNEVKLNIEKAKQKILMYKDVEDLPEINFNEVFKDE